MSGFASWGLTILGLAVVTTVAEMLLPKGKTRNAIRSVFAVVITLVIVTPLPTLLKSGFSGGFPSSEVQKDEEYLAYNEEAKKEMIISSCKKFLKANGHGEGYSLDVTVDGWSVKTASVKFDESIITQNGEHINKSEIIRLIAEYFGIGREAIMTYG